MAQISKAVAIANNESAYLAWDIDTTAIPCCLGFHIVRERPLASYVAFKGQRNPEWQAQNTSVWPVQKFNWRDLTLRKKRNAAERRPDNERVRYRIRAVGKLKAGLDPVEVVSESHRDFKSFFAQPGGRFHAALYELEDVELLKLLTDNAARLDLILSDAGSGQDEDAEPNEKGKQPTIYDTRNAPARAVLRASPNPWKRVHASKQTVQRYRSYRP
ncbi:hypothetical protein AJ87_08940 [Rhizobium yanglingense]|nr:hypothetical protein AJ87_08940 [Rhizobium yanglingense]